MGASPRKNTVKHRGRQPSDLKHAPAGAPTSVGGPAKQRPREVAESELTSVTSQRTERRNERARVNIDGGCVWEENERRSGFDGDLRILMADL